MNPLTTRPPYNTQTHLFSQESRSSGPHYLISPPFLHLLVLFGLYSIARVCMRASLTIQSRLSILPLAMIPLLAEGFLWRSHLQSSGARDCFTFFAFSFWPSWFPFSLITVELFRPKTTPSDPRNRRILLLLFTQICGLLYSKFALSIILSTGYVAQRAGHSIRYMYDGHIHNIFSMRLPRLLSLGLYGDGATMCWFGSSVKYSPIVGVLGIVSYIIAQIMLTQAAASIWCFIAAVFSVGFVKVVEVEMNTQESIIVKASSSSHRRQQSLFSLTKTD